MPGAETVRGEEIPMAQGAPGSHGALGIVFLWWVATLAWWILAFVPLPPASPDWLIRTRTVCFGTLENGLPDTYGWVLLIVSPLSLLAALLVTWGSELRRDARWLVGRLLGRIALGVVVGIPLLGSVWVGHRVSQGLEVAGPWGSDSNPSAFPVEYPRSSSQAPELSLVDQRGERVTIGTMRGRTVLVTFAFAHCQTICPLIVRNVLQAAETLGGSSPEVLIVTLDPWRDTPRSLPALSEHWELGTRARVLSGPVEDVERVLDAYRVPRTRDGKTGDVAHPSLLYVVDPSGAIRYTLNNPSYRWIAEAVRRVATESEIVSRP